MWGTVDVVKCRDPGYQNSHAAFYYCSQLLPGLIPAGLDSSLLDSLRGEKSLGSQGGLSCRTQVMDRGVSQQ